MCRLALGNRPLIRAPSLTFLRRVKKIIREMIISFALSSILRNLTCTLAADRRTHSARSCYTSLSRRVRKKGEEREREEKAAPFWQSGITREEGRSEEGDEQGVDGNGKPEAQLRPSFSAALPIYILRRIYRRMCMFLISWMHKPRARARIDAPMRLSTNVQRCTNSYPLPPPPYPPLPPVSRRASSFIPRFLSFQHKSVIFYSLLSLSLSPRCLFFPFHFLPSVSLCFSPRASSTSPYLFREIPPFLACSLRDPLKSFSLCTLRNSFS